MTLPSNVASVCIDAQPTFCEGGGLGVNGGNAIMPKINEIRAQTEKGYYTQDWHPKGHSSFASTHGLPPFTEAPMLNGKVVPTGTPGAYTQMLWTDHGIAGTPEAELHSNLVIPAGDLVLKKGTNPLIDSYSCVFENDKVTRPRFPNGNTLPDQLRADGIDTVVLSGIALDVCVRDGACDLKDEGFRVVVVLDATAAISPAGQAATLALFKQKGIEVIMLDQLATYFNPPSVTTAPNVHANGPKI
jgi:nicotinamidase/pyrazinamidase